MAEFGIKATELSAPQGAGSSPLTPVRKDSTAGLETVSNALNIFARGLGIKQQEEKEAFDNSIVNGYAKKLQAINEGVRTGQIPPSEASARARALTGEYMAGYSHLYDKIKGVRGAMFEGSEIGAAQQQVDDERTRSNKLLADAQSAGYTFFPFMTDDQKNAQINAYQVELRSRQEMSDMYRRNEELRAQNRYDADVAARQSKELGIKLINNIAGANIEGAYSVVSSLQGAVASGKMTFDEARMQWATITSRIEAQIQAAAGVNPELAGPYRTLFADLNRLGGEFLDPSKKTKDVENQLNLLISQSKLALVQSNPKVLSIVAASELLKQNAELALKASPIVAEAISSMLQFGPDNPTPKSQVIGNPEIEKDVFGVVSKGIKDLNSGKYQDNEKARGEIKNTVDNLLQQFGDMATKRGVDPKMLQSAVDFFSSPEFGIYAKSGDFDLEALDAAKKTFQINYQQTVVGVVDRAISQAITVQDRFNSESSLDAANRTRGAGSAQGGAKGVKQEIKKFDTSNVTPVFNGTGITFKLATPATNPQELAMERRVTNELKQASQAITKLVHIGAHMEGTTNYAQFWEKNKHLLLPRFFTDPEAEQGSKPASKAGDLMKPGSAPEDTTVRQNVVQLISEGTVRSPAEQLAANQRDIEAIKTELSRKGNGAVPERFRYILERELARLEGR